MFSISDVEERGKQLKMDKIFNSIQELAKLRDWLLPMLMNGQVSVQ